jgi:FolB domain-containing protein
VDTIVIRDLTVAYRIGVTDAERAVPQRLQLSLEIGHDFAAAASSDDLGRTIDYHAVCQQLLRFGEGRSWRLIESLAVEIAMMLRTEYGAARATVEVRKFIIPEARYVGVRVTRCWDEADSVRT